MHDSPLIRYHSLHFKYCGNLNRKSHACAAKVNYLFPAQLLTGCINPKPKQTFKAITITHYRTKASPKLILVMKALSNRDAASLVHSPPLNTDVTPQSS